FKMAPLHHHFELKGVPETKVVAVYMIVTAAACLVGLLAYV
ncbi:MAG TPA: phospho-N-acetylmuramoyl-pentapeptide-transferase, partial [Clostridia bacterium]|nr:phospho-N-acetylmuramoyl-pentapeptide-transferase [Clostridia bacterium]